MTFLTSWIFWVIIIAIIVIMAIIGYLAEGTEFDKKAENNQTKPEEGKNVEEINITEENNEPSAWTGEIKKDERHEQVHDVPSIDDWSTIPTGTISIEQAPIEETPKPNNDIFGETTSDNIMTNEESIENEQINPQVIENLDAPLIDTIAIENPEEMAANETTPNNIMQNEEPIENEQINPQVIENLDAPLTDTISIENPEEIAANETPSKPETVDVSAPIMDDAMSQSSIETPVEEQENSVTTPEEQLIEPAPIFDAPIQNPEKTVESLDVLEMPEPKNIESQEEKPENTADDIWK